MVGDTRSGKSAVVRALLWLFKNEPKVSWDVFRSRWAKETEVAVGITDPPCHIGRVRNKDDNYYYIEREGQDIQEFRAFGKGGPPQEVLDLLCLGDVNFQTQMSLPFMLSQSSGAVGRFLNEAADLEVIDRAQSNIAALLRIDSGTLSEIKSSYKIHQEEIKTFDWIDKAEKELIRLELKDKELDLIEARIKGLENIISEMSQVGVELNKLSPLMGAKDEICRLEKKRQVILKAKAKNQQLKEILAEIAVCDEEIDSLSLFLDAGVELKRLSVLKEQLDIKKKEYQDLYTLISDITDSDKRLKIEQAELKIAEDHFHKIFPKICPLCDK